MERDDVEGAKAAAQYFLSLYPYAYNTGDLTEWRAMSHPECIFCASVIENVEALHAQGGYQTGGEITWLSIEARNGELGEFFVDIRAEEAPALEWLNGSSTEASSGGVSDLYFDLVAANGWSVRGVGIQSVEGP